MSNVESRYTPPGTNENVSTTISPGEHIAQLFDQLQLPDQHLDDYAPQLIAIANGMMPHIQSLWTPLNYKDLLPANSEVYYAGPKGRPWHVEATAERQGEAMEIMVEKTDVWNGEGVGLQVNLLSDFNMLRCTLAYSNVKGDKLFHASHYEDSYKLLSKPSTRINNLILGNAYLSRMIFPRLTPVE